MARALIRLQLPVVAWLALSACTRPPMASTTSNVVASVAPVISDGRQTITRPQCGPSIGGNPENPAFSRAWDALPPRLQAEFPRSGGHFQIARDAAIRCRDEILPAGSFNYRSSELAVFDACWRPEVAKDQLMQPMIYLQNDPKSINTFLLPAVTSAFFEFYLDDYLGRALDLAVAEGQTLRKGEIQLRNMLDDLRRARLMLGRAFVADLAGSTDIAQSLASRFRTSVELLPDSVPFQNFLLAHLTDAYYCSAETARQFNKNELARTRGAYLPFVDFLGAPWYAKQTLAH